MAEEHIAALAAFARCAATAADTAAAALAPGAETGHTAAAEDTVHIACWADIVGAADTAGAAGATGSAHTVDTVHTAQAAPLHFLAAAGAGCPTLPTPQAHWARMAPQATTHPAGTIQRLPRLDGSARRAMTTQAADLKHSALAPARSSHPAGIAPGTAPDTAPVDGFRFGADYGKDCSWCRTEDVA